MWEISPCFERDEFHLKCYCPGHEEILSHGAMIGVASAGHALADAYASSRSRKALAAYAPVTVEN